MAKLLPVALNVAGKNCLVVGGGAVAARKVKSLLECGAVVTVVAPTIAPALVSTADSFEWLQRPFQPGDCAGRHLIFACTDERAVNEQVGRSANENAVWCNIADDAEGSDFHIAAAARRGDITIGITTGGGSPALARHLREKLEAIIGPEYEQLLAILAARRGVLHELEADQEKRASFWTSLLEDGSVLGLLREGKLEEAALRVDSLLKLA